MDATAVAKRFNKSALPGGMEKEMEKIRNFDCNCQRKENMPSGSCSKKLSPEVIYQTRQDIAGMSRECRDISIMSMYRACTNDSEMTQSSKKVNKKRRFNRTVYRIKDTIVCRETFCFAMGIGTTCLKAITKCYRENGLVPRQRKSYTRTNKNFLKTEDIGRVVTFIENYAEDHGIVVPCRNRGHRDLSAKLLPKDVTKASVWRLYKDAVDKLGQRAVSLGSFRRQWKSLLPHITTKC